MKQILPDGRIVYTDKPIPSAKTEKRIEIDNSSHGAATWSTTVRGLKSGITGERSPDSFGVAAPGTPIALPTLPSGLGAAKTNAAEIESVKSNLAEQEEKDRKLKVRQATSAYESAIGELERGIEPQAGERTRTSNGASRLNSHYAERQAALVQAVQDARAELDALRK